MLAGCRPFTAGSTISTGRRRVGAAARAIRPERPGLAFAVATRRPMPGERSGGLFASATAFVSALDVVIRAGERATPAWRAIGASQAACRHRDCRARGRGNCRGRMVVAVECGSDTVGSDRCGSGSPAPRDRRRLHRRVRACSRSARRARRRSAAPANSGDRHVASGDGDHRSAGSGRCVRGVPRADQTLVSPRPDAAQRRPRSSKTRIRVRISKAGFFPIEGFANRHRCTSDWTRLARCQPAWSGWVEARDSVRFPHIGPLDHFFMDRFEVTNRQFKSFVDEGGYRRPEFWREAFVEEGRVGYLMVTPLAASRTRPDARGPPRGTRKTTLKDRPIFQSEA